MYLEHTECVKLMGKDMVVHNNLTTLLALIQAVTAVTMAQLTYEIIDDTFGFRYCKLSINNKKNLKF